MESVAQESILCERCKSLGPIAEMRVNGTNLTSGHIRYIHKSGFGCNPRTYNGTSAIVPTRVESIVINGVKGFAAWKDEDKYWLVQPLVEAAGLDWNAQARRIKRDSQMCVSTAMMAVETHAGMRPRICLPWGLFHYFWIGVEEDRALAAALSHIQRIKAEAATALDMVFGSTAQSVRDTSQRMGAGERVIVTPQSGSADAVEQFRNGVLGLFGPAIEMLVINALNRALGEYKGTTPDEDKEILDNTRVVREGIGGVMIKEVPGPTVIDEWMAIGRVYLAVERRKGLMTPGMVLGDKTPEDRMKDSDYNGNKSADDHWEVAWSFWTDRPRGPKKAPGAEQVIIGYIARMGVEQITDGGRFRYDARVEEDFKRLPPKLKFANLHRWIEQAGLFPEILFAYAHKP